MQTKGMDEQPEDKSKEGGREEEKEQDAVN